MNSRKKKKGLWIILILAVLVIGFTYCGQDTGSDNVSSYMSASTEAESSDHTVPVFEQGDDGDTWSVYWYLCASNLESDYGAATYDLLELLKVQLPENVRVVIETGGATYWQNDTMNARKIQRWVVDSNGMKLVQELPLSNMGTTETLADFLKYATTNYPADKEAFLFWNHGGGSVSGAAFDECYNYDSVTLNEMTKAFESVLTRSEENPPLELIGFDTCLMATIDVANTYYGFAKYMVASEEVEPGNGWDYTLWMKELAANPKMGGGELGVAICNAFYDGCVTYGTQAQTTLSVVDLSKFAPLKEAYNAFGLEALTTASEEKDFFAQLGRAANASENYGGNTRDAGYTNMVDLGCLARQTAWMLPSAQNVLDALEDCVIYTVNGPYRSEATGLSCYYSYSGDKNDLSKYCNVGASDAFKYLYSYQLTGRLSDDAKAYLKEQQVSAATIASAPEVTTIDSMPWNNVKVQLNEDTGCSYIDLGKEANDILTDVSFALYYMDQENDLMMYMGMDNDITADWDNGIFTDNFRGVWGAINDYPVLMELSYANAEYNIYTIPVLLNNEEYYLVGTYNFETETWEILGATKSMDENGMAPKEMRQLEKGDIITILWYIGAISEEEDFQRYEVTTVKVDKRLTFGETDLFDGRYAMVYVLTDVSGNEVCTDGVIFDCEDGEIYTTVTD